MRNGLDFAWFGDTPESRIDYGDLKASSLIVPLSKIYQHGFLTSLVKYLLDFIFLSSL